MASHRGLENLIHQNIIININQNKVKMKETKEMKPITVTAEQKAAGEKELRRVNKQIRLIRKRHKLYFQNTKGTIRRLDKVAQEVNDLILVHFLKGPGEEEYQKLNEGVTDYKKLKGLPFVIPSKYVESFRSLQKTVSSRLKYDVIEISYNGSWKPLVRVRLEVEEKTPKKVEE